MRKFVNLTGKRLGALTVLRPHVEKDSEGRFLWVTRCDCGQERVMRSQSLVRGDSRSCGCGASTDRLRHGENRTTGKSPEYSAWSAMIQRVRPESRSARLYADRGIGVCDRWRGPGGYERFLEDMGRKPSAKHSLDRIDNDGNYEPGNCRWATSYEQVHNRRPVPNIVSKGVCPKGHTISGEKDYFLNSKGHAVCYTCHIEYGRQRRRRMKEEQNA